MENLNAPSKEDVVELLSVLVTELDLWDLEEMQVTVASSGDTCEITGSVEWGYQTGYNHWGTGWVSKDIDIEELAIDLISQIEEGLAYERLHYDCR